MHFLVHLAFMVAGAVFSGMFVDYKWKLASKRLLEKIASLQEGLTSKQSEINTLNVNLISANSKIKMLDTSLSEKEKELLQISTKEKLAKANENTVVNSTTTPAAAPNGLRKKRGPYKKKKNYGKPASNNNSGKKAE
jgi:chromosome segregation ATPase